MRNLTTLQKPTLLRVELRPCFCQSTRMPKESYPSSYECDCGHVAHFFEVTVKEPVPIIIPKDVFDEDEDSSTA